MTDITQMLDSMEDAMKLQMQAKAEKRAEKAAREKKEFQDKRSGIYSDDIWQFKNFSADAGYGAVGSI